MGDLEMVKSLLFHMGHGQYLAYSSKSSIFEECIIVFQAPTQFPKNHQDVSKTTLQKNLNFGCSSHQNIAVAAPPNWPTTWVWGGSSHLGMMCSHKAMVTTGDGPHGIGPHSSPLSMFGNLETSWIN
jgi:hypothetical protein